MVHVSTCIHMYPHVSRCTRAVSGHENAARTDTGREPMIQLRYNVDTLVILYRLKNVPTLVKKRPPIRKAQCLVAILLCFARMIKIMMPRGTKERAARRAASGQQAVRRRALGAPTTRRHARARATERARGRPTHPALCERESLLCWGGPDSTLLMLMCTSRLCTDFSPFAIRLLLRVSMHASVRAYMLGWDGPPRATGARRASCKCWGGTDT